MGYGLTMVRVLVSNIFRFHGGFTGVRPFWWLLWWHWSEKNINFLLGAIFLRFDCGLEKFCLWKYCSTLIM